MVTVRVLKPFYDKVAKVDRNPGETFDATERRAEQISNRIPGYVELVVEDIDLATLKIGELRELAKERGVKVPAKATKAEIVKLLEG